MVEVSIPPSHTLLVQFYAYKGGLHFYIGKTLIQMEVVPNWEQMLGKSHGIPVPISMLPRDPSISAIWANTTRRFGALQYAAYAKKILDQGLVLVRGPRRQRKIVRTSASPLSKVNKNVIKSNSKTSSDRSASADWKHQLTL